MAEEQKLSLPEAHRKFAVDLFNQVWKLMKQTQRTAHENDQMLHAAHASRYHWSIAGTAVNLSRGEWQVSRVYCVLKRPQPALYHAQRCLEICQEHGLGDFDVAFAYEALARASALAGDWGKCREYIETGEKLGEQIQEPDDRDLFFSDMNSIPKDPNS